MQLGRKAIWSNESDLKIAAPGVGDVDRYRDVRQTAGPSNVDMADDARGTVVRNRQVGTRLTAKLC